MTIDQHLRHHPLVFVTDLDAPRLRAEDAHHLARSLRLPPGSAVNIGDGRGRWRPARTTTALDVDVCGDVVHEPAPDRSIRLGFVPTKRVKAEWVAQKLTEVGVDEIVVLQARRSVVRWDASRSERNLSKMAEAARAAASQCRRVHHPSISGPIELESFARLDGLNLLADPAGERLSDVPWPAGTSLGVAIGPEGGWSEQERRVLREVALPGNVLRAETAALAAGIVLASRR